ncbi:MAG: TRAP transporter fused permease subunit [Defluviimonas sp.]|jgi:TRAP transporter 4TM/12TM fusion protein|nr:TRAP transporter fused permease subunit [Defluviimonas sp.]
MSQEPQNTMAQSIGMSSQPAYLRWTLAASALVLSAASINHIFNLGFFIDVRLLEIHYLYVMLLLTLPLVYLVYPCSRKNSTGPTRWWDYFLALLALITCAFFVYFGRSVVNKGWDFSAPTHAVIASFAFWFLLLVAARRTGGWMLFAVILIFSIYPMVANYVPGPIQGFQRPPVDTAIFHAMSGESVLGIPMRSFVNLLVGFMIFGVAMQHTGAGPFFIDIAFAALGHVRGGPAKVGVMTSALTGSMSGSVITNVLTTGSVTIPAMKRVGFRPSYAAGIEAAASTGAVLMPPIMGATAFVMASFLMTDYANIVVAAVVPSLLYFFGLFAQIDAYSARNGLKGVPRADLPRIGKVLREGWFFLAVFALLIWMLLYLKREAIAPFYATALLLVLNQLLSKSRWGWQELMNFLVATGRLFVELVAILAAVGLIVGGLAVTGMSGTISNDLLFIAGGNTFLLLLLGALTSFILGMGMTVTAAYVILAVSLAPALIAGGLDPIGVHLFILYWSMLSYITPPVALAAFAAAAIAQARPFAVAFEAMKLGTVIYIIPFFFVLDPAFTLQAGLFDSLFTVLRAGLGVLLICAGLQGYLLGVGRIESGPSGAIARLLLGVAGLAFALPSSAMLAIPILAAVGAGVGLAALAGGIVMFSRKQGMA